VLSRCPSCTGLDGADRVRYALAILFAAPAKLTLYRLAQGWLKA
jgi:hypothetical protein